MSRIKCAPCEHCLKARGLRFIGRSGVVSAPVLDLAPDALALVVAQRNEGHSESASAQRAPGTPLHPPRSSGPLRR